jgi:hexulose-6-phosphate isomerase
MKLHLEMAHGPAEYAALLNRLPHPMLMVNYDSGNSASLGHNMRDEFAAYGPRIGSVHIKDRVRGGSTVPLGTGDADIPGMLEALVELRYAGDFVMEVARGEPGRETELARMNRGFLMNARSVACGSLR